MANFKYELGEIVILDPVGGDIGIEGKIVARLEQIDGSLGYYVSSMSGKYEEACIRRHFVSEYEIRKPRAD